MHYLHLGGPGSGLRNAGENHPRETSDMYGRRMEIAVIFIAAAVAAPVIGNLAERLIDRSKGARAPRRTA